MNKRKLHHVLTRLRAVPYWWFFIAGILLLATSALALRANNQRMIDLRQAVFTADEQGRDIEGALRDLRQHVYSHMNTDLAAGGNAIRPPIQLKYQYERLVLAENAKLNQGNANVYTDAQNFCEQQISSGFSGSNRLQCIRDYVDRNGAQVQEVDVPDGLYKFDFVSPRWSPDFAGLSLVAAILCLATAAVLFLSQLLISKKLKNHHQ